ncbi:hypothetical protein [Aequorivita vladivostokensis]|uniref:hypothetical protein n=1 Tax=Aequorivita vladivostokensis TaxID=171194 RepID=UPI000695E262|nr:hypothetical protein [Aequorivita vladivostokensis]
MTRFLLLSLALIFSVGAAAQNTNLSDYSYVVVPEQFDFSKSKDQYQLNSMAKFYFEKSGFNAYLADSAPNANRCDGLYANVEELKTLFGTKLQVVLKDCNDNEIYRGQEGKSKYKEYDKSYQDALRKAFSSVELLNVKQREVVLLGTAQVASSEERQPKSQISASSKPKTSMVSGNLLPDAKFSNYSHEGKTFLLRKTSEGYSLYEETASAEDGLMLKGKIIIMDNVVKFLDISGKVANASFDASGNLSISDGASTTVYTSVN